MDRLTIFGLFAVTAMVVCYALEDRGRWYVLGFAGACMLGSIYGFLQGAWPFGLVEGVWSAIALQRWLQLGKPEEAVADAGRREDTERAAKVPLGETRGMARP